MNLQKLLPHGSRFAARLPRALAEAAADCAGDLAWLAAPRARRILAANLRAAGGTATAQATRSAFRTYARYYLSILRLSHLPLADAVGTVRWTGREHLEHSLRAGHGALVLSAHFGNWDVVGAALAECGWEPCVFAERLRPPAAFEFYRAARQRLGMTVVPVGDPGRAPWRTLERNGVLGLVADRPFGNRVEAVPFGDAALCVPTGGIRLALRAGAAVHVVLAVRTRTGFDLQCGPDWAAAARRHPGEASQVRAVAAAFAAHLEANVRAHPGLWCCLAELPRRDDALQPAGRAA